MFRKFALPLLGMFLMGLAVLHVVRAQATPPQAEPPVEPARAPFSDTVAGTGIVEAQSENIAVGTATSGVVMAVPVRVGQKVKAGTILFRLDDQTLRAEQKVREKSLASARASLTRLKSLPRSEDLRVSSARLREAQVNLDLEKDLLDRIRRLPGVAVSQEEVTQRKHAVLKAEQQVAGAQADNDRVKAGPWAPDLAVSWAAVDLAQAQIELTQAELERRLVRAPVDGEVLQVNVRPGEFAAAQPGSGLVVLGNVGKLHVRVDIDEHDIPRFRSTAVARAALRGNPKVEFRLTCMRVEPYVVPKKMLHNESAERVDTRVLQVIYAVEPGDLALYVGQQLDVFIEAR